MSKVVHSIFKNIKVADKGRFYIFLFAMFFILMVESVMQYYFPIVVENSLKSNFLTGSIIGLTNIAALICDVSFSRIFKRKTWKYLLLMAIVLQFGFPLFTNLGVVANISWLFVLAAIFWNLYFEFFAFSRHNFILSNEKKEDYSKNWAQISLIAGICSITAPIIGASLIRTDMSNRTLFFFIVQTITLLIILYLIFASPNISLSSQHRHTKLIKFSAIREMSIWEVLSRRILPVLVVGTMITLLYASFATVSGLLGEQLFGKDGIEWILAFLYNLPAVFVAIVLTRVKFKKRKKYYSQWALLLGSLVLVFIYLLRASPVAVVILFSISSLFISISWILNEAVYSDLNKRSGENHLYLNGMERINDSVGFLAGPIIIGFLSDRMGYFSSFGIIGLVSVVITVVLLLVTPRKIRIPHTEIEELQKKK